MHTISPRRAVALLTVLALAATARADTPTLVEPTEHAPEPMSVQDQLAHAVVQVCVNEAGFRRPRDCGLVWQTVARFGRRGAASASERRLAYIRRHSCRVLGQEYCLRPRPCPAGRNCQWTQHLTPDDVPPLNWPDNARFPTTSWRRARAHVRRLMAGIEDLPCAGQPITWGGSMDAERAAAQGLVALDCGDTVNTGYARAGAAQ